MQFFALTDWNANTPPPADDSAINREARRWLWLSLAASACILAPTTLAGFGYDQEAFDYTALVMLKGGRFYVDYSTHNGPGATLIHMAIRALFGWRVFWFRLVDVLCQLGSVALLYRLIRRDAAPKIAFVAAFSYAVFYYMIGYWNTAQRDGFATTMILAMVLLAVERPTALWSLALSAFLGFFCFAIRPTFGVVLIIPAVGGLLAPGSPARRLLRPVFVAAVFLAFAGALVAYLQAAGSLRYLLMYMFDYGINCYYEHDALLYLVPLKSLLHMADNDFTVFGLCCLAALQSRRILKSRVLSIVVIALPFVIFQYLLMRRGFWYQTIPVMALLFIPAAAGWDALLAPYLKRRYVGWALLAGLLAAVGVAQMVDLHKTTQDYARQIKMGQPADPLAKFIKQRTAPNDRILEIESNEDECFLVGFSIYVQAQRVSSSPIAAEHMFATDQRCPEFRQRFMDIYWRGVNTHPPKLVFSKLPIPPEVLAMHHLPADAPPTRVASWWVYLRDSSTPAPPAAASGGES